MASSAPTPKDWRPTRTRFVAAGALGGLGYGLWAAPAWLGSGSARAAPAGAVLGGAAGFLAYLGFRWLVRRLRRAFAPRMRPDRLS